MAASKGQRIGIWAIAVIMFVGTIGSFAIIVLANGNNQVDRARAQELNAAYQQEYTAYQTAMSQTEALSSQYYPVLQQYASLPAAFNAADVTKLSVNDLVVGTGQEVLSYSTFSAYYIGWGPDGVVFDSSIEGSSLKAPITARPGGVIEGWTEGAAGMKVGGVRELTIPASLAYGSTGSGSIAPDTPLKFVMVVVGVAPNASAELIQYYQKGLL